MILPFRPCTIEHFKTLSHDFEQCINGGKNKDECNKETFERANCLQWTTLDTKMDYLDFLGRPVGDPVNITFAGMQSLDEINYKM